MSWYYNGYIDQVWLHRVCKIKWKVRMKACKLSEINESLVLLLSIVLDVVVEMVVIEK